MRLNNKISIFDYKISDMVVSFFPPWHWIEYVWSDKDKKWQEVKSCRPYWTFEKLILQLATTNGTCFYFKIFGLEISFVIRRFDTETKYVRILKDMVDNKRDY